MGVKMIFEPGKVVTWDELSRYECHTIAVDGYCAGSPNFNEDRVILNINHHEGVNRQATRSSCDQALVLVKLGLFKSFCNPNGKPRATLYCNDCDPDVVLTTYILKHPQYADRPKLKTLVRIEDLMDMSGGFFPVKRRWHLVRQLAWITESYDQARRDGGLLSLDGQGMLELVRSMHRRVTLVLFGKVKEIDINTKFEVMHDGGLWKMVREIGPHARIGMVEHGIEAFVALVGQRDGRFRYSLGRVSQFIPFPMSDIFDALNQAEGIGPEEHDRWGGGNGIGGSPRNLLSALPPAEVCRIVGEVVRRHQRRCCPG